MNDLALTLQQLGARHVEYGVLPQHYRILETALLRTLEIGLKDQWNQELCKGWAAVFKFLAKAMMSGCEHELEIIKEEQSIKERKIRLELSKKSDQHKKIFSGSYLMSPTSSSSDDSTSCPRWSPTCVVEPLGGRSGSLSPFRDGKVMIRRNSFDTTPTLLRRTYLEEDEEAWGLGSHQESYQSRTFNSRCHADTILPRPTRSRSPERVLE